MVIKISKINAFTGHKGGIYALETKPDTGLFFSGSGDKHFAQWDLKTMQYTNFSSELSGIIYSLCVYQNMLLSGTSGGHLHITNLTTREEVKVVHAHQSGIFCIKHNALLNEIYTGSADGCMNIYDAHDITFKESIELCKQKVRSIAIDEKNNIIAIACGDGNIRLLNMQTKKEIKSFAAHNLSANVVCYNKDCSIMLSGGRDAHLNVWNTANYELIKRIPAHNFAIYDIVYSPDERLFATASRDKTIKIWDSQTYEVLARINKENHQGHLNSVNKLTWNKRSNLLVSASDDRTILVWQIDVN